MASIVITGASGHLGGEVVREALRRGHQVRVLVRKVTPAVEALELSGAEVRRVDFTDLRELTEAMTGARAVFHLAAPNSTGRDRSIVPQIVTLSGNILLAVRRAHVPVLVYTSSVVVLGRSPSPERLIQEHDQVGEPESPYVEGKLEAEKMMRQAAADGLDVRILYPAWIMGGDDPGETPPHRVLRKFFGRKLVFFPPGGISVAHVAEVAKAHLDVWERGSRRARFVLGGENVRFGEFYRQLSRASGQRCLRVQLPRWLLRGGARVVEVLERFSPWMAPVSPAYVRALAGTYSWYDSSAAENTLGYRIRPIGEALAESVQDRRRHQLGLVRLEHAVLRAAHSAPAPQPAPGDERILLLTGFPGWLGNRMVERFLTEPRGRASAFPTRLRLLVHPSVANLPRLPAQVEIFPADLRDAAAVGRAVEGVSMVFHLAGAIYPRWIRTLYRSNFHGTRVLVDQCIKHGVRRILFMSTDSVCGHGTPDRRRFDAMTPDKPYRHYGRSKWLAEQYLLKQTALGHIDATILRGFWFFGPYAPPRQQNFLRMFFWPRQLVFGHGRNLRSISHVDNTIEAFVRAAPVHKTIGKHYWIGDGQGGYTVDEIYGAIARALGRPYRPIHLPVFVCKALGWIDWLIGRVGLLHPTIHAAAKFHFDIAAHSDAAARDFGYQARIDLEAVAREIAEEMRT